MRLLDAKTSIIPFCISNRRNFELLSRSGVTSPTAPQELQLFCKDSVSCWNASRETKILLLALRYSYPASFIDITLITTVNWGAEFYYKYSGDDSSGHFYYDMNWINGSLVSTNHRIKYDPINKVWYDGFGQGNTADSTRPNYLVGSTSGTTQPASANTTSLTNPAFVWGFNSTGSALFAFDNPYYEAPPGVPIVQSIACTPQGNAVLLDGDYTTSYITYRFNSSDESITYTNGVGWEDLGSNRPYTISSPTGENIDLGMGWGTITLPNPYFVNGVEVGYEAPPSYFLSSPRAIGDWINCADNPFTWNGTTYTLQRTGGSMKYTSDDGTSAIWTYCNSTGGNSQSGDSVKRLSSGGWEDGPGSRPNGNNSINEHNNVLFISHPNTPVEAVWGFDDPYDVSP